MVSYYIYIFLAFIIGAIATAVTIPVIIAFCRKFGYYDQPNKRKVHHQAVPRLGGVSFLPSLALSFSVTMLLYYTNANIPIGFHYSAVLIIIGATIIFLLGVMDDLVDLPANFKFVVLSIGSSALPVCNLALDNLHGFFGLYEIPVWVAYPLTVLVIMTIVNSLNLIDGIDGLASGIAAICLAFFVYLFADVRYMIFDVMSAAMLGIVIAFMGFNIFGKVGRLKIFMGDAGSLILGYVLAYLAIKYLMVTKDDVYTHVNPILIVYSMFIVPVFDLVRVAVTRVASGYPMLHADQRHIHHVLMRCGLTMHQALAVIVALVLFFILGNIALDDLDMPITIIFFLDIALYLLFFAVAFIIIDRRETMREILS